MASTQKYLVLDYETRSEGDLKRIGGYEYARHPSTQILCVAWRVGTREELKTEKTEVWSPAFRRSIPSELLLALIDPQVKILAHNAFFEQVITRFVFSKLAVDIRYLSSIPISRWECTAASAAALGLPRDLSGACLALKLTSQKDLEGHRLMLKMSKPRKATKHNKAKWHNSVDDLKRLMQYCATDIDAETELFLAIPGLNPLERKIWELDQKINWRGFAVDRDLIDTVIKMIGEESSRLDFETQELTGGELSSTNQRDATLRVVNDNLDEELALPNMQAETIVKALQNAAIDGKARRLLEIRQAISKTSNAKYFAAEMRSRFDGRVRDSLMYWGAGPGRWAARGLQPHNFPKGPLKDNDAMETACEVLGMGDLELVKIIYGPPMDAFSWCLRGLIRVAA